MQESHELSELISAESLRKRIHELGEEITQVYPAQTQLICIAILKGSFVFAADLLRSIQLPTEIEFMGLSSYAGKESTGRVQITMDIGIDIQGKDVLIIEDIVDTGTTLEFLYETLKVRKPKSLRVSSLLSKPEAHLTDLKIDHVGFEIADEFVVGFGLDLNGQYRGLDHIAEIRT